MPIRFRFKRRLALRKKRRARRIALHSERASGKLALKPYGALVKDKDAERFGVFEEELTQTKNRKTAQNIKRLIRKIKGGVAALLSSVFPFSKKSSPPLPTSLFVGAICGVAAVCAVSASLVAYALFGSYGGRYTELRVPDLLGLSEQEALAFGDGLYEYTVSYEFNPDAKSGCVISQSPAPSVIRKLYYGENALSISITVNRSPEPIRIPKTVGTDLREAELMLKNAGLRVRVIREYSDTVLSGKVISSSIDGGESAEYGEQIILRVSKGRELPLAALPDLTGLTESEASALLKSKNFAIGKITYQSSYLPLGRVIAQEFSAGSQLAEGSEISFTVSGGIDFSERR